MVGILGTLTGLYRKQVERHQNLPFLKGVMASCARVAMADGNVSFSQRVRIDQIVEILETLKVFDPHEAVDLFNEYVDAIRASSRDGRAKALADIAPIAKEPERGALLLRICVAVSEANGALTLVDQIEIVTLCSELGIDPSDCGLYIDMPIEEFLAKRH